MNRDELAREHRGQVLHWLDDSGTPVCGTPASAGPGDGAVKRPCMHRFRGVPRVAGRTCGDADGPKIMSPSGVVHTTSGDMTVCGVEIRDNWMPPDTVPAPRDCRACIRAIDRVNAQELAASYRIYALRSTVGDREIVKFGETHNFTERLRAIRAAMPEPVTVLGTWRTHVGDRDIHWILVARWNEVVELRDADPNCGRMEWYYRDAEVDRILAVLQADGPGAGGALAKAAAWMKLSDWLVQARLQPVDG